MLGCWYGLHYDLINVSSLAGSICCQRGVVNETEQQVNNFPSLTIKFPLVAKCDIPAQENFIGNNKNNNHLAMDNRTQQHREN